MFGAMFESPTICSSLTSGLSYWGCVSRMFPRTSASRLGCESYAVVSNVVDSPAHSAV